MYCKNCGKYLPANARFCDRCNTSVRKKSGKMDIIEDLKEERLARRKAKVVEERLKNIKKVRRRRIKIFLIVLVVLAILGVASAVTSNIMFSRQSLLNNPIEDVPDVTENVSSTPGATVGDSNGVSAGATEKPTVNRYGYVVVKVNGMDFAYPSSFSADSQSKDTMLSLSDNIGDAKIVVSKETTSATDTAGAMKNYIEKNNISSLHASTNSNSYSITGIKGETTYHRFGQIENGVEFYYEMTYPTSSSKAESYETHIAYMDDYLKADQNSGSGD